MKRLSSTSGVLIAQALPSAAQTRAALWPGQVSRPLMRAGASLEAALALALLIAGEWAGLLSSC